MANVPKKLILASQSPRRREMLEVLPIVLEVHPPDFIESTQTDLSPEQEALYLARGKALSLGRRFPRDLILGCDTLVVLGTVKFGKPKNPAEAVKMLMELSGKTHRVLTGYYLFEAAGALSWEGVEETKVTMRDFSRREADNYAATGEPLDKAGAYGIQGQGAGLILSIQGDYHNVVGLPLKRIVGHLKEAGCLAPAFILAEGPKNQNFPGKV